MAEFGLLKLILPFYLFIPVFTERLIYWRTLRMNGSLCVLVMVDNRVVFVILVSSLSK